MREKPLQQGESANSGKNVIRNWWAEHPMTYGAQHGTATFFADDGRPIKVQIGSRDFFEWADLTFYRWNVPRHNDKGFFGKIFDYDRYAGKRVLEIGCGMGCMAMNWAQHGACVTAVDLNPVAVEQTRRRFETFGLEGNILEADAENLPFEDNSFEYAYSWGVLHHTPDTKRVTHELYRVLRTGGRVGVMLYHRRSAMYRFLTEYVEGFMNLERAFLTPLELASRYADGGRAEGNPHTWPVTRREARQKLFSEFAHLRIETFGTDLGAVFDQWIPGFWRRLPRLLTDACARHWGWSLWITGQKGA
jgi:ubiquinone/menaquinone biosynthesis C-methylase UbiE